MANDIAINILYQKWKTTDVSKIINDFVNSCGITCFAGSNDNILMWSHYASCHKGICMKFDILKDLSLFMMPIKVNYSDEYPLYNHVNDDSNMMQILFSTKSGCWSYENEIRVLKPKKSGYRPFNPEVITEVCFGCNTSETDISKLTKILSENGFEHVKLKKASASKNQFRLNIDDLSNS